MNEFARFASYLRSHGQKMTRPREIILRAFLQTEGHMTTEEILREARRIDPSIGQATVFRTIRLIADAGLAREACMEDGARTFEHLANHAHHDHLVCVRCGKVIEFYIPEIEQQQSLIFLYYGFLPKGHTMQLFGLCPQCQEEEEEKKGE